jgi:hypothetical protein
MWKTMKALLVRWFMPLRTIPPQPSTAQPPPPTPPPVSQLTLPEPAMLNFVAPGIKETMDAESAGGTQLFERNGEGGIGRFQFDVPAGTFSEFVNSLDPQVQSALFDTDLSTVKKKSAVPPTRLKPLEKFLRSNEGEQAELAFFMKQFALPTVKLLGPKPSQVAVTVGIPMSVQRGKGRFKRIVRATKTKTPNAGDLLNSELNGLLGHGNIGGANFNHPLRPGNRPDIIARRRLAQADRLGIQLNPVIRRQIEAFLP